jgi:hypothetical protein
MASYICVFKQDSATLFYIVAISNVGDIDLLLNGEKGFSIEEDIP